MITFSTLVSHLPNDPVESLLRQAFHPQKTIPRPDHLSALADRVRSLARGGTGLDFVHTLFRFVRLEIFFSFVV